MDLERGLAETMIVAHNDLGSLYLEQKRLDLAQKRLVQATQLYEELESHTYLPAAYKDLAQVYLDLSQPSQGLAAAHESLKWAEKNEDSQQQIEILEILGEIHRVLGDTDQAQNYAQQSLELNKSVSSLSDQVKAIQALLAEPTLLPLEQIEAIRALLQS